MKKSSKQGNYFTRMGFGWDIWVEVHGRRVFRVVSRGTLSASPSYTCNMSGVHRIFDDAVIVKLDTFIICGATFLCF